MTESNYTRTQQTILVILRMLIGWHFLYEGIVKLWNPNWSAGGYLADSAGMFKKLFYWMAGNSSVLEVVDFLNVWGLILVGLGLITGFLTRWAVVGGIILLAFYYFSHPPLINTDYALPSEGSYLFVNKNLLEIFALATLLVFPTGHIGLDRFLKRSNA